ncbi:NAD(P)H-dependent flavin oxidoreductase [Hyalangium rubrum]|uniref:Propionate 3-nitronate monooxygenase n=1 Tax=Hyalangium rubrum TaxID=3103134 RepID=A0ABU5H991_9BACT|nr:nitronate monooxygenase [Hyalangium sp. s54d21]MDY7229408.1 nitronate monooxygenase [Hyalangium sp. s54d21]
MARSEWLRSLGVEEPLILAPMAGGPSTPELVAAVSNAGGLGSLGAAYQTPEQLTRDIQRTRELTDKPFGVNLFAGGYKVPAQVDAGPMLALLSEVHEAYGLPPPSLPALPSDPFPEQLEAVLEARPAVFSFTFGIPSREVLARLRTRGIASVGTATTLEEARLLVEAGVDAIAAQGAEAGGHRGTFASPFEQALVPILELVAGMVRAVSVPVIASGGLMDGRDMAAAMKAGSSAVQLGTAFLTCPESGASEAYKRAILAAKQDTTVITRAFSGRPARGLANTFTSRLQGQEQLIPPYPLQNALTRAMRTAGAKRGESGFLSLWAGQGVARTRVMPAGELVHLLLEEMRQAQ